MIGRGSEADITVDDTGISRKHLEIVWDGRRAEARDLGSTNGSTLNGARLTRAALPNDSVLQIGRTRIAVPGRRQGPGAADMSELTLLVLRVAFLALLWVFVFAVVYALRSDLFGGRVRRVPQEAAPARARTGAARRRPCSPCRPRRHPEPGRPS